MKLSQIEKLFFVFAISVTSFAKANEAEPFIESPTEPIVQNVLSENPNPEEAPLSKLVEKVVEKQGILSERARKEIDKYRVRLTLNNWGQIFNDDDADTDGGVYYQLVVEPAFREQEQLRRDIWAVNFGLGTNARASGTIRLTFSRYFSGPDAKIKALTALPYCPVNLGICKRQTPLNSNELKTLMKDKEGFRLEVLGDIGVGIGHDLTNASVVGGASVRVKRAAHFIMDLYKANAQQARTRFVGIKNTGEIEGHLSFQDPVTILFRGPLSFIRRKMSLGVWLGGRRSFEVFDFFQEKYPRTLDTMMVDYQFNFSSPDVLDKEQMKNPEIAEYALDEVLTNVRRGGFASLFLFLYKGEELSKKLLSKIKTADEIASSDLKRYRTREIALNQVRVINHFKGRIVSYVQAIDFGGSALGLINGNSHTGSQSNFVMSYDSEQKPQYYRLENSFLRRKTRSLFGRNKFHDLLDTDVLMYSNNKAEVGEIADVVIRRELQETHLTKGEVSTLKNVILNIVPQKYKQDEQLIQVIGEGPKTNANYVYRSSFGSEAFIAASQIPFPNLVQELIEFFESHPQRSYMHLPSDVNGEGATISLSEYASRKATEIKRIFDPNFNAVEADRVDPNDVPAYRKARLVAFRDALSDPIFEMYLLPEFFSRLIPENTPEKIYAFELTSSSFETKTQRRKVGENTISRVYDSVAFIRGLITDRSLDLQMTNTVDQLGNSMLAPATK